MSRKPNLGALGSEVPAGVRKNFDELRTYFETLGASEYANTHATTIGNPHQTTHGQLLGVLAADATSTNTAPTKHVSDAQAKSWTDHGAATTGIHGLTGAPAEASDLSAHTGATTGVHGVAGALAANSDLTAHTGATTGIHGLSGAPAEASALSAHLGTTTGVHGTTGAVVGTTDTQTLTNKKFGGATHYAEFEADGTLKLAGDATGWKDVWFPQGVPKVTGAGNPSLVAWNGALRGYAYAVGDVHDFDPQEYPHDGLQGGTCTIHLHWVSRTNVAADRGVKWEASYSQANPTGAFPVATTPTATEVTVPSGTAENTHYLTNLGTFTAANITSMMCISLKRLAASGTAPADDPVVLGIHYHYEVDTPAGSRTVSSK